MGFDGTNRDAPGDGLSEYSARSFGGGERPTTMFAKGTEHTGAFCAGIGNRWAGGTNNADGTEDSRG